MNAICVYLDTHNFTVILDLLCREVLKCMLMCHHVKKVEKHRFNLFTVSPGILIKQVVVAVMLELIFSKFQSWLLLAMLTKVFY
jgi:hypothetical protein